jgi:cytochrome oxidase Cu insertion factor (SCO1/SenC/PrrC family)
MHPGYFRSLRAPRLRCARLGVNDVVAGLVCAFALLAVPAASKSTDAANDEFSAMRVRRIAPPTPAGKLVLRATDGRSIKLSDYRGKVVLVEFFLTN